MRDEVSSPGSGISTGGGMTAHSSILPWEISWTKGTGRLQSTRLQRAGHNWNILVLRRAWGHGSGAPMKGISAFVSHWRACFYCSVLCHVRIPLRTLQPGREGSHQNPTLLASLWLSASRTMINQFLLFISLLVSGYVVGEAWAKTFFLFSCCLSCFPSSPPSSNKMLSSFPALASTFVECVLSDTVIYCIYSGEKK